MFHSHLVRVVQGFQDRKDESMRGFLVNPGGHRNLEDRLVLAVLVVLVDQERPSCQADRGNRGIPVNLKLLRSYEKTFCRN